MEFNSQAIANTLWAFATMETKSGNRKMGPHERWVVAVWCQWILIINRVFVSFIGFSPRTILIEG